MYATQKTTHREATEKQLLDAPRKTVEAPDSLKEKYLYRPTFYPDQNIGQKPFGRSLRQHFGLTPQVSSLTLPGPNDWINILV